NQFNEAGLEALRLEEIERQLQDGRKKLEYTESAYQELLCTRDKSIKLAQDKWKVLKNTIEETELETSIAEFYELADQLTDVKAPLVELQELTKENLYAARGRAHSLKEKMDLKELAQLNQLSDINVRRAISDFISQKGILSGEEPSEEIG
ncbi:MAG: hypothetical protein AAGA18_14200, partial [Verrucomicrobiota bacterium]